MVLMRTAQAPQPTRGEAKMDAANFAKRNQKFGKVRPVKFAKRGPKFRKE